MQDLRGHLSRPLNREHFHQLCHSLVDEHWRTSFTFDFKSIERSEKVRFWTQLKDTDCVIGINCQWHGRNVESPTTEQIDAAVAVAAGFHPYIDLYFVLFSGTASEQLNKYVAHLNQLRKANGQFAIQLWGWEAIEELLATCPRTVKKYLTLSVAMKPYGFAGAIDSGKQKIAWLMRLPDGRKKDRNKPASGNKPQAVFNRSVTDAFEQFVHANQYRAHSRYLRVAKAPSMGHAVALIHHNHQIELWLLSPEPRDTEFRADTELWVRYLMEHAVKDTFAHVLLKNYHDQDRIRLRIHIVQQKSPVAGNTAAFTTYSTHVERSWHQLYPGESLKNSRYVVAEAVIEDDQVKVTQSAFLYGCTMTHVYHFPVSSASPRILRNALVDRFYPNAVPHSHEILLDSEQIYWRSLGEFDAHARRQNPQSPTPVTRMNCRFCNGAFWGYRGESRCAVCDLKQGMFGRSAGDSLTHNDLFQRKILRPPWDF
ncbi:MAG: hypothetical protein C0436_01415 [Alphaproteobacteria bacterium]|nr:hypothetical protein [Alphaproteobacteria bacterium]